MSTPKFVLNSSLAEQLAAAAARPEWERNQLWLARVAVLNKANEIQRELTEDQELRAGVWSAHVENRAHA